MATATASQWNPFGVSLDLTATTGTITRTSATQFTVIINVSWKTHWNTTTNYGMTATSGGSSVTLNKFGTYEDEGNGKITGTYTVDKNVAATKTISVTFKNFNNDNGDSKSKSLSLSVSVPAWTSYTITYNANGGVEAPRSQKKWKGQSITLSDDEPYLANRNFLGWATSSTATKATYKPGETYTADGNVTLYAVWGQIAAEIRFDANGGSNAPATISTYLGYRGYLPADIPTRAGYEFLGWDSVEPGVSGTTPRFDPGGQITVNKTLFTLSAVWKLVYTKPRITNLSISRCKTDGTISDDGTSVRVIFEYECDQAINGTIIAWETSTCVGDEFCDFHRDKNEDSIDIVIPDRTFTAETTYTFKITVEDTGGYSTAITTLQGTAYTIDFLAGGKGAAFGKPSELENVLDIAWQTRLLGGLLYPVIEPETDLNDESMRIPGFYVGENVSTYNYVNCPITAGTFTLEVLSAGINGQVLQRLTRCDKLKPLVFQRYWYGGSWGEWFWAGSDEVLLYEDSAGSTGTITMRLNNEAENGVVSASHFRYLEIYFTDNNGKGGGYTKIWDPNGKTISLQITEPSTSIYSRQTFYTISGSTVTPNVETASYYRITSAGAVNTSIGTNYIKIVRIVGRP